MKSRVDEKELELFQRVRKGDREALRLFIEKHKDEVYRLCWCIVQDDFKAEELAADTFMKFYESVDTIRKPESFKAFMLRIARYRCYDWLKEKKRKKKEGHEEVLLPSIPDEDGGLTLANIPDPSGHTAETLLIEKEHRALGIEEERQRQLCTLVNEKMAKLPPKPREAIYEVHFKKRSYKEASEILDCPIGDVKSRVNRGMISFTWSLIRSKVRTLPTDLSKACRLKFEDKLSYERIGEELGCPKDTAKCMVKGGLKRLWRPLQEEIKKTRVG